MCLLRTFHRPGTASSDGFGELDDLSAARAALGSCPKFRTIVRIVLFWDMYIGVPSLGKLPLGPARGDVASCKLRIRDDFAQWV